MSGKSFVLLAFLGMLLLRPVQTLATEASNKADINTIATEASGIQHASNEDSESLSLLLIMGLREQANRLVRKSVAEEFSGLQFTTVDAAVAASSDYIWPIADIYLAAGETGCQIALEALKHQKIVCTLLTKENFLKLKASKPEQAQLSALVIDQPVSRQARIANHVYPSLNRFSVFSRSESSIERHDQSISVENFPYRSSLALPSQLSDALSTQDALIATPDSAIFNSSTLSTVLLTAYGYHRPVIGFSRAYVKAGALITCYSTPAQILREIAQRLRSDSALLNEGDSISYPKYFSVSENTNIAKSLGLIRRHHIDSEQTLSDQNFKP